MKTKIVIMASGGVVNSVRSTNPNIEVEVLDFDNHEDIVEKYQSSFAYSLFEPKIKDTNKAMDKFVEDVICKKYPNVIF